jgi:hypothetical protein
MKERINKYEFYEKETIRLSKRLDEISKEIRNQPYIQVPPFQRGWETSIVLREDISNRKDADFILHLINIGYQQTKHIRSLEHVKLIRRGILVHKWKSKYDDKIHSIDFVPDKIRFSEKQYEELTEREKPYFLKDTWWLWRYHDKTAYYINIPSYWIKLKVTPCMYDRIMDKNGELETEYSEIKSKLYNPPYSKYFFGRYTKWNRISKEQNRIQIHKMKLKEGLKEYELEHKIN